MLARCTPLLEQKQGGDETAADEVIGEHDVKHHV